MIWRLLLGILCLLSKWFLIFPELPLHSMYPRMAIPCISCSKILFPVTKCRICMSTFRLTISEGTWTSDYRQEIRLIGMSWVLPCRNQLFLHTSSVRKVCSVTSDLCEKSSYHAVSLSHSANHAIWFLLMLHKTLSCCCSCIHTSLLNFTNTTSQCSSSILFWRNQQYWLLREFNLTFEGSSLRLHIWKMFYQMLTLWTYWSFWLRTIFYLLRLLTLLCIQFPMFQLQGHHWSCKWNYLQLLCLSSSCLSLKSLNL